MYRHHRVVLHLLHDVFPEVWISAYIPLSLALATPLLPTLPARTENITSAQHSYKPSSFKHAANYKAPSSLPRNHNNSNLQHQRVELVSCVVYP